MGGEKICPSVGIIINCRVSRDDPASPTQCHDAFQSGRIQYWGWIGDGAQMDDQHNHSNVLLSLMLIIKRTSPAPLTGIANKRLTYLS
jgi:hypothetical protein